MEAKKNVWKTLSHMFPAQNGHSNIATRLFREYESKGYLKQPAEHLLKLDLSIVADFFHRVSLMHSQESPVLRRRDTRWMSELDYTYFNIRAAGTKDHPGNFLQSAILLATLRTRGILLAPVTQGSNANLNALESHILLRNELINTSAQDAGIEGNIQMMAFSVAAHLLGLTLGFELDFRVDPYAAVVLRRPELFFWTCEGRFDANEAAQNTLRARIRETLAPIEQANIKPTRKALASALDAVGLAPKPSIDGSGRTPLAFRYLSSSGLGDHRDEAVGYWGRVFDLWRERYSFDFLVLRGTRSLGDWDQETPDRSLIRRATDAARRAGVRRNIGVMAEGNPKDVENFGLQGVNLVISNDADDTADRDWFLKNFSLDDHLQHINRGRKIRFSVPLEVNPGNDDSCAHRERALLKRFTARFFGTGPSRRPLLETMGAIEGAWGYNTALEKPVPLEWMPHQKTEQLAQNIENIATAYIAILKNGETVDRNVNEQSAWWVIRSKQHGLLVAVCSIENKIHLRPESTQIDFSAYIDDAENRVILEFDFLENRGKLCLTGGEKVINAENIPYRGFRLYHIS